MKQISKTKLKIVGKVPPGPSSVQIPDREGQVIQIVTSNTGLVKASEAVVKECNVDQSEEPPVRVQHVTLQVKGALNQSILLGQAGSPAKLRTGLRPADQLEQIVQSL